VSPQIIRTRPSLLHEKQYEGVIAGIDEVGRGSWAGPVVAACVVFHTLKLPRSLTKHIHDSKLLTEKRRLEVYKTLATYEHCSYAIAQASPQEIDQINIREATFLAMKRSFEEIDQQIDVTLIDGNASPKLPCKTVAIIRGDQISLTIAAASIIAKVYRDQLMTDLGEEFPHYGWDTNAGYGTKKHQDALKSHGVTPHHRSSFAPIRELLKAA
jgi:ribonuclease HII